MECLEDERGVVAGAGQVDAIQMDGGAVRTARADVLHGAFTPRVDPRSMTSTPAPGRARKPSGRRSTRLGVLAAVGMAAFYAAVVAGASGSVRHLIDQARADWFLLAPIIAGFGLQVGLIAELRRRRRLVRDAAVAGATGASGSTVGMIACCAHHLADVVPFVAATGAATFLTNYRVAFMVVGLAATAAGVTVAAHHLRHLPAPEHEGSVACVAHSPV